MWVPRWREVPGQVGAPPRPFVCRGAALAAVVFIALLSAAPAAALDDGTAPRHDKDDRCTRMSTTAEEDRVAVLSRLLGGDKTREAWKELRKLGGSGCEEIAEWLRAEAPGARGDGARDAHLFLLERADGREFQVGLDLLATADAEALEKVAGALRSRHAWVGPSVLATLSGSTNVRVQEALAELLLPDYDAARKPLTEPHHIDALRTLVTKGTPRGAAEVADGMLDWMREGNGTVPAAWSPVLLDCIRMERLGPEWEDASGDAARVLATTEIPALDRAIDLALEQDLTFAQEELIDGLIDRMKSGDGTNATLQRLTQLGREADRGKLRVIANQAVGRYGG